MLPSRKDSSTKDALAQFLADNNVQTPADDKKKQPKVKPEPWSYENLPKGEPNYVTPIPKNPAEGSESFDEQELKNWLQGLPFPIHPTSRAPLANVEGNLYYKNLNLNDVTKRIRDQLLPEIKQLQEKKSALCDLVKKAKETPFANANEAKLSSNSGSGSGEKAGSSNAGPSICSLNYRRFSREDNRPGLPISANPKVRSMSMDALQTWAMLKPQNPITREDLLPIKGAYSIYDKSLLKATEKQQELFDQKNALIDEIAELKKILAAQEQPPIEQSTQSILKPSDQTEVAQKLTM